MAFDREDVGTIDKKMWTMAGIAILIGMALAVGLFFYVYGVPSASDVAVFSAETNTEAEPPKPTEAPKANLVAQPTAVAVATVAVGMADHSAESSASKLKAAPRLARAEPNPETHFVLSAAEITAHLEQLARQESITLNNKHGVRVRNGKITFFGEQLVEKKEIYHEIVFVVSAENGQVRVTLERAVTDGHQMSSSLQAVVLQRLASELQQLVETRSATNTVSGISYQEGELIFKLN